MNDEQFKELSSKLDKIMKLLAISALGGKRGSPAIEMLSSLGFQPKEIAEMLGTTSNTVSVSLSKIRKKRKTETQEDKVELEKNPPTPQIATK